eukprot:22293_1
MIYIIGGTSPTTDAVHLLDVKKGSILCIELYRHLPIQQKQHPSVNPTVSPTMTPAVPTALPSMDSLPKSITISCRGSGCHFDQDIIVDTINNFIIAYLDEDARIIGTKITTNKVSIIIASADSNALDHDVISRDIEAELKDQYDVDVDATFNDTDDDEDYERYQSNSIQFIVIGVMIGSVVFLVVLLIGCTCFYFCNARVVTQMMWM